MIDRTNPYIGPLPFTEGKTLYGRRKETQVVFDLVISKRIVLLISPSGAGKTSLIQASLLPKFKERLWPLPIIRLGNLSTREGSEDTAINPYRLATLRSLESGYLPADQLSEAALALHSLGSYLTLRTQAAQTDVRKPFPLLIFDQFEELFTLDRFDWERKKAFIEELGNVLGDGLQLPDSELHTGKVQQVWSLFSMREDYVAELEPYLDLIPTALMFRYRLEPLEREQAVEAIVGPAQGLFEVAAAERLVNDLSATAQQGERSARQGRFVEPVQLQVVSLRLWDKVVVGEQRSITAQDIDADEQVNEVDTALAEYYEVELRKATAGKEVRERYVREWIEEELLTGTRVRTRVLREVGLNPALDEAVDSLINGHLLRADSAGERTWLELSHDRLIKPILRSNERWRETHLTLVQKRAAQWARSDHADNLLLQGSDLENAQQFAQEHPGELNLAETEFLRESQAQADRIADELLRHHKNQIVNKRLKWVSGLALVLLCIVGAMALSINEQRKTAREQQSRAERHEQFAKQKEQEAIKARDQASQHLLLARMMEADAQSDSGWALRTLSLLDPGTSRPMQAMYFRSLFKVLGSTPPLTRMVGDGFVVRGLQFSDGGDRLYSGDWNGQTSVWPLGTSGAPSTRLQSGEGQSIQSLVYNSPRKLLVSSNRVGQVLIWQERPEGLVQVASFQAPDANVDKGVVVSAQLDASGNQLVTTGNHNGRPTLTVWNLSDLAKPVLIRTLSGYHRSNLYKTLFVPAGKYQGHLVSADVKGNLGIWNTASKAGAAPAVALHTQTIIKKDVGIFAMAISPSGRWLAAGTADGSILFWDLWAAEPNESGVALPSFMHHGRVTAMVFSRDGTKLYSVGGDKLLLEWTLPGQQEQLNIKTLAADVQVVRFDGWGEKLYSIAVHPTQDGVIAIGGGSQIRTVDLNRLTPLTSRLPDSMGPWRTLSFSTDRRQLVSLAEDNEKVRLWHRGSDVSQQTLVFPGASKRFTTLALSGNGQTLATLTCDGLLEVWSLSGEAPEKLLLQRAGAKSAQCQKVRDETLLFHPSGHLLVSAVGDQLQLWGDEEGSWRQLSTQTLGENARIKAVSFDPTGKQLAVAGNIGGIQLWSVSDNQLKKQRQTTADAQALITVLAFSTDGQRLASGGDDASVVEWSVADLQWLGSSQLHNRALSSLSYLPQYDASLLVSGDMEGQLVLCSTPISEDRCDTVGSPRGTPITSLGAGEDELLVSSNALWLWQLQPDVMRDTAVRLARKAEEAVGSAPQAVVP